MTKPAAGKSIASPSFWQWMAPTVAALCLMLVLFGFYPGAGDSRPNISGVSVLAQNDGGVALSVLVSAEKPQLWLEWRLTAVPAGKALSLWAVSGEAVDYVATFAVPGGDHIALTARAMPLARKAEAFILTVEEPGASIDAPKGKVLASGEQRVFAF